MAIPGTPGVTYTADGLEHTEAGVPSSQARDHRVQLDKRERKLALYDYGPRWAELEGEGATGVITFGSATGPVREAVQRAAARGVPVRLIALRLLAPLQPQRMTLALEGVRPGAGGRAEPRCAAVPLPARRWSTCRARGQLPPPGLRCRCGPGELAGG